MRPQCGTSVPCCPRQLRSKGCRLIIFERHLLKDLTTYEIAPKDHVHTCNRLVKLCSVNKPWAVASAAAEISPSSLDALIALAEAGLHASARERLLAPLARTYQLASLAPLAQLTSRYYLRSISAGISS